MAKTDYNRLIHLPVRDDLARMKYIAEANVKEAYDSYLERIVQEIANIIPREAL